MHLTWDRLEKGRAWNVLAFLDQVGSRVTKRIGTSLEPQKRLVTASYFHWSVERLGAQGRDSASHLLILQAGAHPETSHPLCGQMLFLALREPSSWPVFSLQVT